MSRAPTAAVADSHRYFAGVAPAIGGRVRRGGRKEEEGGCKRQELCDVHPSNHHGSCDLMVGLNDLKKSLNLFFLGHSSPPSTNHMTMSAVIWALCTFWFSLLINLNTLTYLF